MLEEFKTCLPEKIVVYLNEQKADSLSKAAVCADEFVLTHRVAFSPVQCARAPAVGTSKHVKPSPKSPQCSTAAFNSRECFFCHETGHLAANCPALQRKDHSQSANKPKSVGFVQPAPAQPPVNTEDADEVDESYRPFISKRFVSLTGKEEDQVPITILRHTGDTQSLMLQTLLPFSPDLFCGSHVLVWGLKMSILRAPLHTVFLQSPLVSCPVQIGLHTRLPV